MATIAFAVAAAYIAPEFFTTGSLAATAFIASAATAGSLLDSYLLGKLQPNQKRFGPRLQNNTPLSSIEGDPIDRCYGRCRVSGEIIWSTRFLETVTVTSQSTGGGKGGGGGSTVNTTTYNYSVSVAIGLCQGPITKINRIWADGKVLDLTSLTYRIYLGTETQAADPKIQAVEGSSVTPAYRGLAYIVFEDMPLADYGNRIPQFSFEVWAPSRTDGEQFENDVTAVIVGPGSGEFIYMPSVVSSTTAFNGGLENCTNDLGLANWEVSMDQMQGVLPNLGRASLVVSWMGTDLRCANCEIRPEVEVSAKTITSGQSDWVVSGISRGSASVVSTDANGPLLGGTPSDLSVYQAIQDLSYSSGSSDPYRPVTPESGSPDEPGRGLKVTFYPFILMDIPDTNSLPNPYSANGSATGQEAFPWRGRITVSVAPGETGTKDKTATAATEIATFFGSASASDFGSWNGTTIPYSGSDGFTYRRFILHYAKLCIEAGGVDTFIIGSELKFLNCVRDNTSAFPAVSHLATLAADVKAMFVAASMSTKVTYAADWSEWNNYAPSDGSNDLYFHLDTLWANSNIDYIAIDNYMPLADWRDTLQDLDYQNYSSIYDEAYLQSNIEGGEDYAWYYASAADRVSQTRTNITDGTYSKPWVFRAKDIRNWWLNLHYNRPSGTESGSHTSWVPQSKPIIFTELGCPAVNKGANQPNVFYDPKSGESALPYFSSGSRDDVMQRSFLKAVLDYWNPTNGNNPNSSVYSAPMIDNTQIFIWTWDARPYPDFPTRSDVWRDAPNYEYGHWLNGRMGQCDVGDLITTLCAEVDVAPDVSQLHGLIIGYTLDRIMSPRDAIDPLSTVLFFDPYESEGTVKFRHRGGKPDWTITDSQLIPIQDNSDAAGASTGNTGQTGGGSYNTFSVARTQDTELPGQSTIKYNDEYQNFQQAIVLQRRQIGASDVSADSTLGIVSLQTFMQAAADVTLMDAWLQREQVSCTFPPQFLGMDAADVIELTLNGVTQQYRVQEVDYAFQMSATLVRTDQGLYFSVPNPAGLPALASSALALPSTLEFVELGILADDQTTYGPWFAIYSNPWQTNAIYNSPTTSSYALDIVEPNPSVVGTVNSSVAAGPEGVWDMGNTISVTLASETATLSSLDDINVLAGGNIAAIQTNNGGWEVIQFANASLISGTTYTLSRLLRAQLGTDVEMASGIPSNATFVLLSGIYQSRVGLNMLNVLLNWKWGPLSRSISDPSFGSGTYAPKMQGLRPYSPCQLQTAAGPSTGDITLSWVRRDRAPQGSDNWDLVDIPMSEASESYDVDIYNGSTVVRTFAGLTSPTVDYTAAEQTTDFGSTQSTLKFAVYQNSATYGRGSGRTVTLSVPGHQ